MSLLHDPFDLLDTDIKVAPILPASKLDEMVARAVAQSQMDALPTKTKAGFSYRLYGGVAIAACLLMTFGFLSLNFSGPNSESMNSDMASSYSLQPKQKTMFAENDMTDLGEVDIGDYVILATFEDQ